MRKFFYLCIITCFLLFVSSCETTNKLVSELTIISVNDFHGALDESDGKYGVARLASSISAEEKNAEASVLISAGDMFQGTALSNYDHGKTVIDIMNKMKFDAMVIGNHEFDWGFEEIYQYVDGSDENGEATFPFLGCNIIEKNTGQRPEGVDAYQIVNRGGLKIAIVGYMGEGNESDIAEAMIGDYQFANPIPYIKSTISDLRVNQGVDVVIVSGHEGNDSNQMLASLEGDERVDAIINAHTHSTYSGTITRTDGIKIPYVQAGSAGEKFGLIKLSIDQDTKQVTGGTAEVKYNLSKTEDSTIKTIVSNLKEETLPVFGRVIGSANEYVDRYGAADWAATALKEYATTDIAVINIGGIRAQAFPIEQGTNITVSKIYEIMPFDNVLKTVDLKGSDVRILVNKSDFVMSSNAYQDRATGLIYINGEVLDNDKMYSVATIDYIFDKPENPFLGGENISNTGILFRDILIQTVEKDGTIIIPIRGKNE